MRQLGNAEEQRGKSGNDEIRVPHKSERKRGAVGCVRMTSTMKSSSLLRFALSLLVLSVLSSCGSEFRSAWKKAPVTQGAEGKWEGTWLSEVNGHHGKLRCVVGEPTCGHGASKTGVVPFFYHATWKGFLSGSYKAEHQVRQQKDGSYVFKGEHKMPDWAGGLYHYHGTIKGDDFNASYKSSADKGTFTMKRVR